MAHRYVNCLVGSREVVRTEPTMSVQALPSAGFQATSTAPPRSGKHLPGYLLLAGTQRLRRSNSLKLLREIERAPFASPEEVAANQLSRLSALLSHAETHVPYYRELFRTLGVRSADI